LSFASQLKTARKQIIKEVDETRQATTIELFSSVILDTPIDTGRARGNWQVSMNAPIKSEIDRLDTSGNKAVQDVIDTVMKSFFDGTIYLTNNLPYIEALEFGSSNQMPEGMVRRNVNRIQQIIRAQAIK